jgi:hypothetical protein
VEVAHTNLTKVTRMVLIEVGSLETLEFGEDWRLRATATHRWWC